MIGNLRTFGSKLSITMVPQEYQTPFYLSEEERYCYHAITSVGGVGGGGGVVIFFVTAITPQKMM